MPCRTVDLIRASAILHIMPRPIFLNQRTLTTRPSVLVPSLPYSRTVRSCARTSTSLHVSFLPGIRFLSPSPPTSRCVRCEVIFEHEGFCSFGHFSRLRTSRAAVVPAASLLNLSRPPRAAAEAASDARKHARAEAHAYGKGMHGASASTFLAFAKGTNPYNVLDKAPAE